MYGQGDSTVYGSGDEDDDDDEALEAAEDVLQRLEDLDGSEGDRGSVSKRGGYFRQTTKARHD